MRDRTPKNLEAILQFAEQRKSVNHPATFIICGKTGATGKTWLCFKLREAGHTAFEITEGLGNYVKYCDDENHMIVSGFDAVVIILNKPLDGSRKLHWR